MDKALFPAGYYECPNCSNGLEVFVPLTHTPTHCCGLGKRIYTMVYKGEKRDKARNSVRGLGKPSEDG